MLMEGISKGFLNGDDTPEAETAKGKDPRWTIELSSEKLYCPHFYQAASADNHRKFDVWCGLDLEKAFIRLDGNQATWF